MLGPSLSCARGMKPACPVESGGKVTRDAGPVKGGKTVIAFVEDPTGYKWELIERKGEIKEPIAQVACCRGSCRRRPSPLGCCRADWLSVRTPLPCL
jgi:hypothetical protein